MPVPNFFQQTRVPARACHQEARACTPVFTAGTRACHQEVRACTPVLQQARVLATTMCVRQPYLLLPVATRCVPLTIQCMPLFENDAGVNR